MAFYCAIFFTFVFAVNAAVADTPENSKFKVTTVASNLEHPWGLAILPDRRLLVTERPGRMRIVDTTSGAAINLKGVPHVFAEGQAGLLDVILDPKFGENRLIYFSYAEPGHGGAGTAVGRAVLTEAGLEKVTVIFRQMPKTDGSSHWGSRLVFGRDGTLFVTLGDRYHGRDEAQSLSNHLGKIVRINSDGSIPRDNPFITTKGALPEIWSYGHRNVQGAALHPETGILWAHEHGARGGDEINIIQPGRNYGWPIITHGVDYSGAKIGIGVAKEGMEQPIHFWTPSIAPSGMTFYSGAKFLKWRGDLFVGALVQTHLARITLDDGKVTSEEQLLRGIGKRIRDVREGLDGNIYLLTDSAKGEILVLTPS